MDRTNRDNRLNWDEWFDRDRVGLESRFRGNNNEERLLWSHRNGIRWIFDLRGHRNNRLWHHRHNRSLGSGHWSVHGDLLASDCVRLLGSINIGWSYIWGNGREIVTKRDKSSIERKLKSYITFDQDSKSNDPDALTIC